MRRFLVTLSAFFSLGLFLAAQAGAHCQVPCGIYGDSTRFDLMREHIQTIEKSMKQVTALGSDAEKNWNQIVRWVENKEDHTSEFTEIVTYYFLAQRIKPADKSDAATRAKYQKEIELLHHMIVYAMKCKQTTDTANTAKLTELVDAFEASYMGKEAKEHMKEH